MYRCLSRNKNLLPQLHFKVEKKTASEDTAPSECEKRLVALFNYDPTDLKITTNYYTRAVLDSNFRIWMEQPSLFWGNFQQDFHLPSNPEYLIIVSCLKLNRLDAHTTILRRLYCIVLHRLRASRNKVTDAETIARSIHDLFHPAGTPLNGSELGVLTNDVRTLVDAGSRYSGIAEVLGIGSLFFLGQVVARGV